MQSVWSAGVVVRACVQTYTWCELFIWCRRRRVANLRPYYVRCCWLRRVFSTAADEAAVVVNGLHFVGGKTWRAHSTGG